MLQNLTCMRSPTQFLHKNTQKLHDTYAPTQNLPTPSLSTPIIKQYNKYSRRELTIFTSSSLLLLSTFDPSSLSKARAEDNAEDNVQQVCAEDNVLQTSAEDNAQQVSAEDNVQQVTGTNTSSAEDNAHQVSAEDNARQVAGTNTSSAEDNVQHVRAKDNVQQVAETNPKSSTRCSNEIPTKLAFLDISIDGGPTGRIIVGLYEQNAPVGAARFRDLVSGKSGISFRRKEFVRIMPNYVQHGGVRSYGVDAELARRTGSSLTNDSLIEEWQRVNEECEGIKNMGGTVSIIVRDPTKPPPKMKLVAREGKLEIDQEEVGVEPNGTEFTIALKDSPELDSSTLVVGRVIEGMDVVKRIGEVKTVQENTSSPYFRVAKLIGDKRAVVAERGFNRPYSKVMVTNCGLLE